MINAIDLLGKAYNKWNNHHFETVNLRFGQYFINNYTKGYVNPEVYYETDSNKAYTELLWVVASGELDGKLIDNSDPKGYNSETNQTGGA